MNNDEIKTMLQKIWELYEQKEAYESLLSAYGDEQVNNTVDNKLSEIYEISEKKIVFPKLTLDAEKDTSTGRETQCNSGTEKGLFQVNVVNIEMPSSSENTIEDINRFKEKFTNMFLELESNYREIKEEYLSKKAALFDEEKEHAEKEKKNLRDSIDEIDEKIRSFDIIHEKYIHLIPNIINMLEEKRAGSLTDALNIAIQDEKEDTYRSEQLEIERQKLEELQRKNDLAEEEMITRNEIMERDLEENRRMQEEHNRQMQEYAEMQADAAIKQASAAEQQAKEIERANREAERNEKERQRKLHAAALAYESAAHRAAYASEHNKAWRESEKESAYAEMQKYK